MKYGYRLASAPAERAPSPVFDTMPAAEKYRDRYGSDDDEIVPLKEVSVRIVALIPDTIEDIDITAAAASALVQVQEPEGVKQDEFTAYHVQGWVTINNEIEEI